VIGIERGLERIRSLSADTAVLGGDRLIVAGCREAVGDLHTAIISACALD